MSKSLNLARLSIDDAATALQTSRQTITKHIANGAPTAGEGIINLVHYAAWLNSQLQRAGSGES